MATFQPDEAGEWSIAITHKGAHIQGGPFNCFVFDPNGVRLTDTEGAIPGQMFSFIIDASATGGLGSIVVDLVHDKHSITHYVHELSDMRYRVSFVPNDFGKYRVYVYFNGSDVRGSPFAIRVGNRRSRDSRDTSTTATASEKASISSLERKMNGLNTHSPIQSSSMFYTNSHKSMDKMNSTNQQHFQSRSMDELSSPKRLMKNDWSRSNFNEESTEIYKSESKIFKPAMYENAIPRNCVNKNSNYRSEELKKKHVVDNDCIDTSSNVKGIHLKHYFYM